MNLIPPPLKRASGSLDGITTLDCGCGGGGDGGGCGSTVVSPEGGAGGTSAATDDLVRLVLTEAEAEAGGSSTFMLAAFPLFVDGCEIYLCIVRIGLPLVGSNTIYLANYW
ncbi:hypothetical protein LOK49_LG05G02567 [Camellia lanceoleosa]|uniref:Uncharacterized protein n=1 Tax=Camellia lanceoleosa TaxID=1840588 RepID=A0ACC0HPM6_9ERIC|nr:hypothetical protein LOK49_LG05G02567 [Camellia lanceoleosa]